MRPLLTGPSTTQSCKLEVRSEDSYLAILVRTEKRLQVGSTHRKIINRLTKHIDKSKYRCFLDFLFLEFFPFWKGPCFKFYEGNGPSLLDHPKITPIHLEFYDQFISGVALESAVHFSQYPWSDILEFVDALSEQVIFSLPPLRRKEHQKGDQ